MLKQCNTSIWHLQRAAKAVAQGGVIAYPTEAVYGLGCDPHNFQSVKQILALKKREQSKGLIVIASNFSQLEDLVYFPDDQIKRDVEATWPGPVTWVLPAKPKCPEWLKGEHEGLAVRVSSFPVVRALCELTGPLVSTSANPSSKKPAKTAFEVIRYFHGRLDGLLPEKIGKLNSPTIVKNALTQEIYRHSK